MQEVGSSQRGSQRAFSVLDRLLLTHPVWLQLSLNQEAALYILLREPVGTFLVRKCSSTQRKVLCLRVTADRSASSVKECFICEEDSTFALESSALSFPDLCRLVAFYCISRDVLPLPLQLPDAIARASTHRQLEAISHMGQGRSLVTSLKNKLQHIFGSAYLIVNTALTNHSASNKRHRFKRSMRLRLSESSMNLSLEGVGSYSPPPSVEQPGGSERLNKTNTNPQRREPGIEVALLALERRPAPSLAELDSSSSFSSMDEDHDSDTEPESMFQTQMHAYHRPPLVRSRGRGGLHRMSEAFVCFFAPDKRLTRLVEELSRDRRSIFGGMVQDFLLEQRELLQGLRLFLSQAKCCLLDSGELEPPIETLRLSVRTGVPDSREVERVKQKLVLMQRTHSPIDKVLLLLQVCKCVHKAMGSLHGETAAFSWDDFLPSLSYVIVECNKPHILIEVEYMMELLEPSWLGGEGRSQTAASLSPVVPGYLWYNSHPYTSVTVQCRSTTAQVEQFGEKVRETRVRGFGRVQRRESGYI
uniref:Uncharacterized protein n=1 Tax=Oreochromis aureus TaxID=47969 RepID=A0AAZ1XNE3_OREAU